MKVLHLIESGGLYGAEMMLLDLMDEQKMLGIIPVLGAIRDGRKPCEALEGEARCRGHEVREYRLRWGVDPWGVLRIAENIRDMGIEVLHTHGYKADIYAGTILRPVLGNSVSWVVTLHGWTSVNKWCRLRYYEKVDATVIRWADRVVLVSPEMQKEKRLQGINAAKLEVIRNGIKGMTEKDIGDDGGHVECFCRNGFIIGSTGRLSPEKNYGILVEAVAELVRSGMDAKLVIIGEGDDRKRLLELAERCGLTPRFLLPGYFPKARRFLKLFHVFALTSLTEGLPISLLEAMAAGVPAVVSAVGNNREILGDGSAGFVYEAGDRQALVESLRKLALDQILRQDISTVARSRVAREYGAATMACRYEDVYRTLQAMK